jgi:hypothetical protein
LSAHSFLSFQNSCCYHTFLLSVKVSIISSFSFFVLTARATIMDICSCSQMLWFCKLIQGFVFLHPKCEYNFVNPFFYLIMCFWMLSFFESPCVYVTKRTDWYTA